MIEQEHWKEVEGWPWYQVSDMGRVKSILSGKIRRYTVKKHGYCSVVLSHQDRRPMTFYLHRLVAKAYVPNPLELPDIHHINGEPWNNWATNLQWVTHKENLAYAVAQRGGVHWMKGVTNTNACTAVIAVNDSQAIEFKSIKEASAHFKMNYSTFAPMVCKAIKNHWSCKGYLWSRKEP